MGVFELGDVVLKDGETVTATRIVGPDPDWAPVVELFLIGWKEPWITQVERALICCVHPLFTILVIDIYIYVTCHRFIFSVYVLSKYSGA